MRSRFETKVVAAIKKLDPKARYEPHRIKFMPTKPRHYTPDVLLSNGIYVEIKGRFTSSDRAKHLLIREQHPELDIRFIFMRSQQTLTKVSKTTYGEWCDKQNILWSDKKIPEKWLTS